MSFIYDIITDAAAAHKVTGGGAFAPKGRRSGGLGGPAWAKGGLCSLRFRQVMGYALRPKFFLRAQEEWRLWGAKRAGQGSEMTAAVALAVHGQRLVWCLHIGKIATRR